MKNNKTLGVVLWAIGLLIAHLIIFCVPQNYTVTVWLTYGFTLFAFLSQLIFWLYIWRKPLDSKESFSYTSVLMISVCFILLQLALCIVFAFWAVESAKAVFLVNALLLMAALVMQVLSMIAKNHIERVDSQQKDHRVKL